jgi:gamma-F420-2:alpha-L-glutamate ligase
MEGWVLYSLPEDELTEESHGVNRLREASAERGITLSVHTSNQFDVLVTPDDSTTLILNESRVTLPDFIIPRIGANISYSSLALLRHCEKLGVHIFNMPHALMIAKDKLFEMQVLNHAHIPIAKTMLMKHPMSMKYIRSEIGFPLVIKTITGTEGRGVHLCKTEAALEELVGILSEHAESRPIIIQEFIEGSYGCDLRVFVVGGEAIGCMQRIAAKGFKANYALGGRVEPYLMTPEIKSLAEATANIIGLEIAGIDLLFDGDKFKVCEANSSPGFKGMEIANKIDIAGKIMDHVQCKVEERRLGLRT